MNRNECVIRWRVWLIGGAFLALLLLSGLSVRTTQAQDQPPPDGTVPPLLFLPVVLSEVTSLPAGVYEAIPVDGHADNRPAALHGDINLALRSYTQTLAALTLIDLNGDTDANAPQLDGLFAPMRAPTITLTAQVYAWDWACNPPDGCRGQPLTDWEATLIELATEPNEALYLPWRAPEIYGGGYRALVIYAEATRITLVYTRRDGADHGYVVHLEDLQVDAGLLALYNQLNAAGRDQLPAMHNGERLGYASSAGRVKVAIRDTGQFMDPRSRKDWWIGYLMVNGE